MSEPESERPRNARTFHHADYAPARIAAALERRGLRVSVCLPARECAKTIAAIVATLSRLRDQGIVAEVVVIDAGSSDGTAAIAGEAGAGVYQESELMPELGPVLGKGDAMYRALSVLSGDLVCYLDADTEQFSPHFATGLIGPLACEQGVSFVKAFYRRPFGENEREGGGRVNHLTARPALAVFYPELSAIRQPLAGEVAARRELLEAVPYATGYGVEIAMLIDVWRARGLGEMAQVDLEEHRNRHQSLAALAPMAQTVLATIARRLIDEGRLTPTQRLGAGGLSGVGGQPDADWPPGAGELPSADGLSSSDGAPAPVERPPLRQAAIAP